MIIDHCAIQTIICKIQTVEILRVLSVVEGSGQLLSVLSEVEVSKRNCVQSTR